MAIISQRAARSGRGVELYLLILSLFLGVGGFVLTQAGLDNGKVDWQFSGVVALISLVVGLVLHLINRRLAPYADPVLLPIVVALNGVGLAMIYRLELVTNQPFSVKSQIFALVIGMVAFCILLKLIPDHRQLARYTYISMIIAILLLLSPMIPGLGKHFNGARIWISVPYLGSFQPAELAKIFLSIFFASYLTEQRDNLALAGPKVLGLQLPRARHFGPILVVWILAVAILVVETDLGTSLLLFGLFLSLLYVATNRVSWVIIGLTMLSAAALVVSSTLSHVAARFDVWINAFDPEIYNRTYGGSHQLITGLFGMASGGLLGTGWGQGMPQLTPISYSDYIYTAIAEELGLTGSLAILMLFMVLCLRGLRCGYRVRDGFGALLAAGISFTIALQVFVVVGGVTRIIPVTGLTLPFVAHGGSALICNWIMLALLVRVSDASRRPSIAHPKPNLNTPELNLAPAKAQLGGVI